MKTHPDILVIGLGPAGGSAALAAAQAGCDVLGIEKKDTAGAPVQCAEFVPMMIGADVPLLHEACEQTIVSMRTWVEGEGPDLTPEFPGHMIHRDTFDAKLANAARDAGAELHYGVCVRAISETGVVSLSDGTNIIPKIIIGADGPHSIVGAAVGQSVRDMLETRQITVPLLQPFTSTDIFLSKNMPGGYAWAFPKGEVVNIGLGVEREERHRLKPMLAELHAQLCAEGRVSEKIIQHTGGAIPASGMVEVVNTLGNVTCLLAGDAAGLTNPVTGAGISSAVLSGNLAGEAAAGILHGDAHATDDYTEDLEDLFGASLARALAHRARLRKIHADSSGPQPNELKSGWIAYDAYWQAQPMLEREDKQCHV